MVTAAGTNPVRVIVTARSAAVADPSAVSARTAAAAMKSLRMKVSPVIVLSVHIVVPRSDEKHLLIRKFLHLALVLLTADGVRALLPPPANAARASSWESQS